MFRNGSRHTDLCQKPLLHIYSWFDICRFPEIEIFQRLYYFIPKWVLLYSKINIKTLLYSKTHFVRYERRRMRDWVLNSWAVQMNFEKCSFLTKFKSSLWPDLTRSCRSCLLRCWRTFWRLLWHGHNLTWQRWRRAARKQRRQQNGNSICNLSPWK